MGRDRINPEIEDCGSISPNGRICNHSKGHKGKCIRIEDGKKGKHVIEYWEKPNELGR